MSGREIVVAEFASTEVEENGEGTRLSDWLHDHGLPSPAVVVFAQPKLAALLCTGNLSVLALSARSQARYHIADPYRDLFQGLDFPIAPPFGADSPGVPILAEPMWLHTSWHCGHRESYSSPMMKNCEMKRSPC